MAVFREVKSHALDYHLQHTSNLVSLARAPSHRREGVFSSGAR